MAPYGVLEVADEPLFRIVHANPTAQRLLENRARFGVPLGTIAPLLTNLVAFNRLDGEASFVADVGGVGVHATLRRASNSLLIYLDSTAEDIGVLRRAIATTAHEIRGPVAVLCGIAESISSDGDEMSDDPALAADVVGDPAGPGARQHHRRPAHRGRGAARLRCGWTRAAVEPIEVIDAVINDRYLVTVSVVVQDERKVFADPLRLEQMLGNLVGNAVKYGRAPFVVGVRSHPDARAPGGHRRDRLRRRRTGGVPGPAVPGVHPRRRLGRDRHRPRAVRRPLAGRGPGRPRSSYAPSASGGACFTLALPAV